MCPKTFSKAAILQIYLPKCLPKTILQSGSRKLLLKVAKPAPESCFRKRLLKIAFKSYSPKLPFFKAILRQCCCKAAKLLPTITPQLPKANLQSTSAKAIAPKRLPKAAPQSCSPKLRFFKIAVQSCSSKLLPKAAPQSGSPALLHKIVPKAVLQSCCPKAAESCSSKLLLPEAASWSGNLSKVVPQSCYPKQFPGAAPQSCAPKLFSKAVALKPRFCTQNGSPKPFCKAAPESCASKLLPEAAVQSYCPKAATFQTYTPKRFPKAILQSGSRKLLPKVATKNVSQSYSAKRLPKVALKAAPRSGLCTGRS